MAKRGFFRPWRMLSVPRRVGRVALCVVLVLILLVLAYVAYVFASYHRIADNTVLSVEGQASGATAQVGVDYRAVTYNVGFGAYTPEYTFFMDGGKSSWAESPESVTATIQGAAETVQGQNADLVLLEEIDLNATRSYHIDESALFAETFGGYCYDLAVDYDSPFLFYPFTEPHGKSLAAIGVYSRLPVTSALRRSLPISEGFSKFIDLDRCYSVSRIPVESGRELVVYAVHMSAYGNSDAIRKGQIEMLCNDMQAEYEAGNYVLCGGDFNHDLKASEEDTENCESWAFPFPRTELPEHFTFCLDLLTGEEQAALWNSARNADMEYVPDVTYTVTLDGFIISDNIECLSYENINTGYAYSDHDPVRVAFVLRP